MVVRGFQAERGLDRRSENLGLGALCSYYDRCYVCMSFVWPCVSLWRWSTCDLFLGRILSMLSWLVGLVDGCYHDALPWLYRLQSQVLRNLGVMSANFEGAKGTMPRGRPRKHPDVEVSNAAREVAIGSGESDAESSRPQIGSKIRTTNSADAEAWLTLIEKCFRVTRCTEDRKMTDACEWSFQELKKRLVRAPVLTLPTPGVEFEIYCDASHQGVGCVLMQKGKVVAYASRQLKKHEYALSRKSSHSNITLSSIGSSLLRELKMGEAAVLCVPSDQAIKDILEEAHSSTYAMHPGSTKIYRTLKKHYWWPETSGTPKSSSSAGMEIGAYLRRQQDFYLVKVTFTLDKLAKLYVDKIVSAYGAPVSIVSDPDSRFTSKFCPSLQQALGTKFHFSTAFHPHIDCLSERTIQTLEDMLRACVLQFKGNWDAHLSLMEFAYNNSFHSSIGMTPYEALYGRRCRTPVCWDEVGERKLVGPELVQTTSENVKFIRERLKTVKDRQKRYADKHQRDLEFEVSDKVFLKLSPWKGVLRFGRKEKLSPKFIGSYEILECIGYAAYHLASPMELSSINDVFHVSMLRKYVPDPSHILEAQPVHLKENLSYEDEPIQILNKKEQMLRNKVIPLVKVL
ncbi:Transposon Ty3-G Gag-Pol polyprotein [Cucumis melo var. makuwa]|uniref:Transposon Ty3-G Gag-Pol polyprotein n=1 Tax=Cucumis melo var. makuwa TaxID=1194695 RepID=A0A5D3DKK8_CUCMM|nr:Transposon Ty3-G Gag-Pol polyprotein [Cucumis melo var. makuwa]